MGDDDVNIKLKRFVRIETRDTCYYESAKNTPSVHVLDINEGSNKNNRGFRNAFLGGSLCTESFIIRSNKDIRSLRTTNKIRGLSPLANYTDRTTAACRRSKCQLLRIKGCQVVSAADPLRP
jgi:hypothetical protein